MSMTNRYKQQWKLDLLHLYFYDFQSNKKQCKPQYHLILFHNRKEMGSRGSANNENGIGMANE